MSSGSDQLREAASRDPPPHQWGAAAHWHSTVAILAQNALPQTQGKFLMQCAARGSFHHSSVLELANPSSWLQLYYNWVQGALPPIIPGFIGQKWCQGFTFRALGACDWRIARRHDLWKFCAFHWFERRINMFFRKKRGNVQRGLLSSHRGTQSDISASTQFNVAWQ